MRGGATNERQPTQVEPAGSPPARSAKPADEHGAPFVAGHVRSADTGAPIEDAVVWLEPLDSHALPHPLLGADAMLDLSHLPDDEEVATAFETPATWTRTWEDTPGLTNAEGRFGLSLPLSSPLPGHLMADEARLFAFAPGFVATWVDVPSSGQEVVVELEPGLTIQGRVVDPSDRVVEGARVRAVPRGSAPRALGRYAWSLTGRAGTFALSGLTPGALTIEIEHDACMPFRAGPVDPQDGSERTFTLTPAWHVRFEIETSDGEEPVMPRLQVVRGNSTEWHPLELQPSLSNPPRRIPLWITEPVRVACTPTPLVLRVRGAWHGLWTSDLTTPPAQGGTHTHSVVLPAAPRGGSATVRLVDPSGAMIRSHELDLAITKTRVDGRPTDGSGLISVSDTIRVHSGEPGLVQLGLRCERHAPVEVTLDVRPIEPPVQEVRLGPAATVLVRFAQDAPDDVRFRIYEGDVAVPAWPMGKPVRTPKHATGAPDRGALVGGDPHGNLFTGLGRGTYRVVVEHEGVHAEPVAFRCRPGEITSVDVPISRN